jgi:hypothetical protein
MQTTKILKLGITFCVVLFVLCCAGLRPVSAQWQILQRPADLWLEKLDVTALGAGKYRLTATLRNGGYFLDSVPRASYPGGGQLVIGRAGVGRVPTAPGSLFFPTVEAPGSLLKTRTIPALGWRQAITLTVDTFGRGNFWAAARPVPNPGAPALPEANTGNNSKTNNTLKTKLVVLNSAQIATALNGSLGSLQVRLNETDSFVNVPGMFNRTFSIPARVEPWFVFPFAGAAVWYVSEIHSNSVSVGYQSASLNLCIGFETEGDEILGEFNGGPDSLVPNVNGIPLQLCVELPMTFDAFHQYLSYVNPVVNMNASWSINGILPDALLPDINGKIESRVANLFNSQANKDEITFQFNTLIRNTLLRDAFGNTGQIKGLALADSIILMNVEVPWDTVPGGL